MSTRDLAAIKAEQNCGCDGLGRHSITCGFYPAMKSSKAVADTGREAFEKWATDNQRVGNLIGLERNGDSYMAEVLDADWTAWQASRAAERWISVEDELPDNYKTVIICHENSVPYVHVARRVDHQWFQSHENTEICTNRVTHWQPLPNPPAAMRGKAGQ